MAEQTSRRSFLHGVLPGVAAVPVALGGLSKALGAVTGEAYWALVRSQFSFSEERVPMNAANLCPSPRAVAERVERLTRDVDEDCSFQNRDKFKKTVEISRGKIAGQLGVSTDELAIVRNTSEANGVINNGLPLKPGDEVLLWDQNHPTNNVAWDVRAARFGIRVRRVATPKRPTGAYELVGTFEKGLTERTRVLSITHVSNVSGVRLPVKELGELAHRRGIYVHVDGAQTWGALDVDLKEMGCDSYSASAHKWFLGPREAGILYVKRERIGEIWPNTVGAGWGDDAEPDVVGARKFESLGQRDDACLAALATAAEFHAMIGPGRVEARVLELAAVLKGHAAEAGLKLLTPRDRALSGGVCIVEAPEENRRKAWEALYRDYGIAGATTGGLRLCPHIYNTRDHVHRAGRAMKALRQWLV